MGPLADEDVWEMLQHLDEKKAAADKGLALMNAALEASTKRLNNVREEEVLLLQQARSAVTGASSATTAPAPVRDSLTEALYTGASSGRVSEVVTEWERRGSAPPLSRSASACSSATAAASPTAASPATVTAATVVADDAGAERGVAAVDHLLSLLDRLRDERDACKRQADEAAAAHARSMAAVEAEKAELQASVASYGELVKEKKRELRERIETLEAEKEEMRLQLQAHEEAAAAAAAAAPVAPATPVEKVSAASQTEAVEGEDDESVYTDSESDDEDVARQEAAVMPAPAPAPLRTGFVTLLFNLPCPDAGVGRRRVSSSSAASSTTSLDLLDDTDAGSLSPASAAASAAAPASESSEGASSVQVSSVLRVTEADTVRSVAERAAQVLSRKYDVQVDLGAMCLRVGQDELAMEPPQAVKALVRAASGGCCCGTGRVRAASTTTPPSASASASAQPSRGRTSSRLGRSRSGSAGGVLRGRSNSATRLQGESALAAAATAPPPPPRELRSDCGRELRSFPFVRALLEAQQGSAPFHFTAAFVEGVVSRPLLGRGASFARAGLAGGKPYGLGHYAQQQQQQQLLHTSLRDSMRVASDGCGPAGLGASARFTSPLQRAPVEIHRRL